MDLIGIENEAEFFPAGTLSDSFQDELREITSRWSRSGDGVNPVDRLMRCSEPYLTALRQIRDPINARPARAVQRARPYSPKSTSPDMVSPETFPVKV